MQHHPEDLIPSAFISAQVERQAGEVNEWHSWGVGDAWGYRRGAYRRMAELLGGVALQAYDETWALEPEHTRHIHQLVTPKTKYTKHMEHAVML